MASTPTSLFPTWRVSRPFREVAAEGQSPVRLRATITGDAWDAGEVPKG